MKERSATTPKARARLFAAALLLFLFLSAPPAAAFQDISATLVAVLSGDTMEVRYGNAGPGMPGGDTVILRLFGIRCPRPGEPFGNEARDFLRQAAGERTLRIGRYVDDGSFGEDVALVSYSVGKPRSLFEPGPDTEWSFVVFQEELLKAGLAETDSAICRGMNGLNATLFCEEWKALETRARREQKGMWKRP